jgi:hypothetical protein
LPCPPASALGTPPARGQGRSVRVRAAGPSPAATQSSPGLDQAHVNAGALDRPQRACATVPSPFGGPKPAAVDTKEPLHAAAVREDAHVS